MIHRSIAEFASIAIRWAVQKGDRRMADDREMWLSARAVRRGGDPDDPEWDDFVRFLGIPHLREVRSIDSWCNPCLEGNYPVYSLDELWERLELLSPADPLLTYHLLFTDALAAGPRLQHPQLHLLGYDLSDETWTSRAPSG